MKGSSPLTRGKRGRPGSARRSPGLIPAHAGKTGKPGRSRRAGPAHPRSRGENGKLDATKHTLVGSSPLTRGKPVGETGRRRGEGLIPAHAGKTPSTSTPCIPSGAHPRSRGENSTPYHADTAHVGSSPLTRGKLTGVSAGGLVIGLIPAHAGKTIVASIAMMVCPAHPRSRGENLEARTRTVGVGGSSPLTRGKRRQTRGRFRSRGLIPAHAGKTTRAAMAPEPARAHPRSRGENASGCSMVEHIPGSSPLTRGKLEWAARLRGG